MGRFPCSTTGSTRSRWSSNSRFDSNHWSRPMGATFKASALVATAVHRVEVREIELPRPGSDEVLVEALYTCISPGTELRCLAGLQRGTTFPFIPGYAMVGRVARAGSHAGVAEGTIAFLMGSEHGGGINLSWGGHMS